MGGAVGTNATATQTRVMDSDAAVSSAHRVPHFSWDAQRLHQQRSFTGQQTRARRGHWLLQPARRATVLRKRTSAKSLAVCASSTRVAASVALVAFSEVAMLRVRTQHAAQEQKQQQQQQ